MRIYLHIIIGAWMFFMGMLFAIESYTPRYNAAELFDKTRIKFCLGGIGINQATISYDQINTCLEFSKDNKK